MLAEVLLVFWMIAMLYLAVEIVLALHRLSKQFAEWQQAWGELAGRTVPADPYHTHANVRGGGNLDTKEEHAQ